ncbi:MAG: electron transfer flavoprotein subunit alpha/FixB family protein [Deferrisomatales bacterium]
MAAAEQGAGGLLAYLPLPEGEVDDAGRGLLAEAATLARVLGVPWRAACLAAEDPAVYEPFGAYGVPELLAITSSDSLADLPEALAAAVAEAARGTGCGVVLMAHTDAGAVLAPAVAARLGAALFTEAEAFEAAGGELVLARRVLGPRAVERRAGDRSRPLVLTLAPRALSPVVPASVAPARPRLVPWAFEAPAGTRGVRVLERIPPDPQTVDVSEAEVIFCAGKGCDRRSFDQLQELARLVHASLGVTRPVYDQGFAGFERMIGQTGKTVVPRFYLGLGISGSMHHVGGIKDARTIVCLNSDPKAPMFPNSDEGFVADVREVLPLLLEKVRAASAARGDAR